MLKERGVIPNFTNEAAKRAEQRMRELLEIAETLEVEVINLENSKEEIIEHVREGSPERYELVVQRLGEEGLSLDDLSKDALLDRLLGIDVLFRFDGRMYAVDVTTGKSSAVVNKIRKAQELEGIYRELGISNTLIVRLREEVTVDTVLDLFSQLEDLRDDESIFSAAIKYPKPKETI